MWEYGARPPERGVLDPCHLLLVSVRLCGHGKHEELLVSLFMVIYLHSLHSSSISLSTLALGVGSAEAHHMQVRGQGPAFLASSAAAL